MLPQLKRNTSGDLRQLFGSSVGYLDLESLLIGPKDTILDRGNRIKDILESQRAIYSDLNKNLKVAEDVLHFLSNEYFPLSSNPIATTQLIVNFLIGNTNLSVEMAAKTLIEVLSKLDLTSMKDAERSILVDSIYALKSKMPLDMNSDLFRLIRRISSKHIEHLCKGPSPISAIRFCKENGITYSSMNQKTKHLIDASAIEALSSKHAISEWLRILGDLLEIRLPLHAHNPRIEQVFSGMAIDILKPGESASVFELLSLSKRYDRSLSSYHEPDKEIFIPLMNKMIQELNHSKSVESFIGFYEIAINIKGQDRLKKHFHYDAYKIYLLPHQKLPEGPAKEFYDAGAHGILKRKEEAALESAGFIPRPYTPSLESIYRNGAKHSIWARAKAALEEERKQKELRSAERKARSKSIPIIKPGTERKLAP